MKFLQEFWYVLKDDVMELFNEFHSLGKFVKSINSTFLVPIAENHGVKDIKDFRSISLVGCIYKLIAKVLVRRLSQVLGEVIGECQHAFVEGRQILDAIMSANEVVDDLVACKKEGLICKLDVEKAYDYVS